MCPECQGRGKKSKRLRKQVRLLYQKAVDEFEKNKDEGTTPLRPKGHLHSCVNCGGSGLLPSSHPPIADKENGNYIKITARIPSGNESTLVMAYGDENSRNGAFLFTLKGDTLFHDYLIRISSQYRWYSRNNSWLNLFPVINSIEIKQADILKGD